MFLAESRIGAPFTEWASLAVCASSTDAYVVAKPTALLRECAEPYPPVGHHCVDRGVRSTVSLLVGGIGRFGMCF